MSLVEETERPAEQTLPGRAHRHTEDQVAQIATEVLNGKPYATIAREWGVSKSQISRDWTRWLRAINQAEQPGDLAQHLVQRLFKIANEAQEYAAKEIEQTKPDRRFIIASKQLESDSLMRIARLKGLDKIVFDGKIDFTLTSVQTKIQTLDARRKELEAQRQLDTQIIDAEIVEE